MQSKNIIQEKCNITHRKKSTNMLNIATKAIAKHLKFHSQGNYKPKDIFSILVGMATQRQSVHSIQGCCSQIPTETPIRYHLSKISMEDIERNNHLILSNDMLSVLSRIRKFTFAIDYTDDPYYGKITDENKEYVLRGKEKKSTIKFYRYVSLYLIDGQLKLTLAMLPVKKGIKSQYYVKKMIDVIRDLGLKIKVLLVDRGFYSVKMFRMLYRENIPYIVPAVMRGKRIEKAINKPKWSSKVRYTIRNPWDGSMKVIVAVDIHNFKGDWGKHGRWKFGYVVQRTSWSPRRVQDEYRKRFGIEASYRMRNIVRPRTSSRDPKFRYLLAMISMQLKNIWVILKRKFFSKRQRGPKVVDEDTFRFDHFRLYVWHLFIKKFGMIIDTFPDEAR